MNMGFWVPEANFYRQPPFLVSCQIIAWTSSQLCPDQQGRHSREQNSRVREGQDILRLFWGICNIYTLLLCTALGPCFAHGYVCTHLVPVSKSGKLTSKRMYWALRAHRSTFNSKARSRTGGELNTTKPGLGWEREEVNGMPQIYLASQFSSVWTASTKLLFWRTTAVQRFPSRRPLSDNKENLLSEQND